jgi:hypothetical protein
LLTLFSHGLISHLIQFIRQVVRLSLCDVLLLALFVDLMSRPPALYRRFLFISHKCIFVLDNNGGEVARLRRRFFEFREEIIRPRYVACKFGNAQ